MKIKFLKIIFSFVFVFININLNSQTSYNKQIDDLQFFSNKKSIEIKGDDINKKQTTKSNVTFTAMNVSGTAGNSVTIPIYISDVTDLASFQFSIEYDNTQLTYNSCNTWLVPGTVTIQEPSPGHLTFVWAVGSGSDYSNGLFFNLVMDIDGAATGMIGIKWSDNPTARLVGNSASNEISSSWINGSVNVSGTTNPALTISDEITTINSSVSVPINGTDLYDLCAFQWTINYDATRLTYVNCSNWATGIDVASILINDDGSGTITFAYNYYPNGVDIVNGKFFDLNFTTNTTTGVAPVTWSSSPTVQELSNSIPAEIVATWNNGSVTISTNPTIIVETVNGVAGNPVTVPVNALNISNLCAFQWTIDYDETKLTYTGCSNWAAGIDSDPAYLLINDDGSKLTFAYNNYPNTLDIANGKFFDLNFTINAAATGTAPVIWSDAPTPRELSNNVPNVITADWTDGAVNITQPTSATITIDEVFGIAGNPVTVPVNAKNLTNMTAFQWTIDYDETKLSYTGCSNWATGIDTDPAYLLINDDGSKLTFAYNDYPNTLDIADGKFFDLNFTALGGASGIAPVIWSDSPTPREVSDNVPNEITVTWNDGRVIFDLNWDGSESTDWQNTLNWTPEFIPTANVNAIIPDGCPNYPVIDDNLTTAVCNDITIGANSSVEIATNGQMTVSGIFTNNAGTSGLIIKSDATGDGSLIMNSNGVNATIERYLSKTNAEAGQWHFVGSPITAAPLSLFNTNNFYQYNENADDWWTGATYFYNDPSGWQVPAGNLTVGQGYIYYYYGTTLNFEGEINYNAAGYSTSASYTTHAGNAANGAPYTNFDGWLCVSNPYPSALDWTAMSLTDVNNTVYFYDDAADNYKYYSVAGPTYNFGITVNGGSKYIAPGQGFFVKSDNAAGGTFTVPNAARVHYAQPFWKGDKPKSPDNLIRFQLDDNQYSDEMVVYFMDEATSEFDGDYDAYKRFSWNPDVPQIYTLNNDKNTEFAINSSKLNLSQTIPLGYKVATTNEYTIKVTELTSMNFDYIYLEDLNTGTLVNLFEQSEYSFIPENTEIDNDRFLLHFGMNQAPTVVNQVSNQQTLEDDLFSLDVQNTFEDYDMEDSFTVDAKQADGTNLPAWLTFDTNTETFEGTPKNNDVGIVELKLIATDKYGGVSEVSFNVEVINTNDAPIVLNEIANQQTLEDDLFSLNVQNTFKDIDIGDSFTVVAKQVDNSNLPMWLVFNSDTKTFEGTPLNSDVGVVELKLIATDTYGAISEVFFTIEVINTNDSPAVVNQVSNQQTLEDDLFSLNVQNTFEDIDIEDGFTVVAKQTDGNNLPTWLVFNSDTETFEGTPLNSDVGIVELKLIATDTYDAISEDLFTIEVINTNDAPTVSNEIENQIIYDGFSWIFQFNENTFDDVDLGDELTYSANIAGVSLPNWLSFNSEGREFIANPTQDNIGTHNIEVIATDNSGAFISTNFVLTVLSSVGIEKLNVEGYYIYPNPTKDLINIKSKQKIEDISIIDVSGKQIYFGSDYKNLKNIAIDLSDYSNGIYIITIKFEDNSTVINKIIKK